MIVVFPLKHEMFQISNCFVVHKKMFLTCYKYQKKKPVIFLTHFLNLKTKEIQKPTYTQTI